MPPKQKEAKKGPVYKQSIAPKDIIPADVKEPPRDPKPFKVPQTFPDPPKNIQQLPALFEEWPSQQVVKAYDFGLNSEAKYLDTFHEQINAYLSKEGVEEWKPMNEIQFVEEEEEEEEEEQDYNNSKNQIQSFKHLSNNEEDNKDKPNCIIETFMRPETEEEMQSRLKDEAEKAEKAAKDKKKGNKKEQPKDEGPIQVSDVKMSDVITHRQLGKSAVWIGSQLQIIKQRNLVDVYSGEAVWRKIYPQQAGVPQLTKSGKYWVKLLYMGKYIKVEVDDRVPVDQKLRELFPVSAKHNQKWTLILTKALIKYLIKASNDPIIGNGLISYALTGMISQTIPVSQFKQWQKLDQLLNNQHYERKDVVVGCYSSDDSKSFRKKMKVRMQKQDIDKEEEQLTEREVDTRIMNGYSYCIGDYFDNDSFNMVFSQEKSQKEMLLKHEYNQLCKISIANKSRQQKLEYRRKKKELKEKLAIQQKKRLELIAKDPIHYHFLKVLGSLRVQCQYGEKEILLAKKCVLNKLNQPPKYDIPMEKEEKDTKSLQSLSVSVIKYKEESQLFPNIHDFSALPGIAQLLARPDAGVWIQDIDLLQFFQSIQVLYNPNIFSNKKIEAVESKKSNCFTYDQNKQILVVEKVDDEERIVRLLFGQSYQSSPNDCFTPYTMMQKFDFDGFRATSNVVTLNQNISSKLISLKNQNSVFKLNTMSRGNYNYWISADSPFKLLSIADYLTEYEGYTKKNVIFQYPPIEANTYLPLVRLRLKQEGTENTILLKLVNAKQELLSNLNYRLIAIPKQQGPLTSQQEEGVIKKPYEKTLLSYEYSRFIVSPQFQYFLVVEAHSEQNIPDGNLQLILLSKEAGLTIQTTEQVEPVKFIQKYAPNKYGLICKERIFTNTDNNATLTFRIVEYEEVQGGGGGKAAKKGGKEEVVAELIEKPYSKQRSVILRIFEGDKILYEEVGINEITVPNFKFYSTKAAGKEYSIQFKFDLRVWPEAAAKSEETQSICWVAQVISQDSLAFVRDTKQEDKQKQIRKSWEESEPGRAERAKKARRRFLIEVKKENGEALTEEEEQIINAPRLTKKQQMEEDKKNQDKKGGKAGKKEEKKPAGKDAKKEEVAQQKVVERVPPKSQDNFMNQIKQFLGILENCVIRYQTLDQGVPRIRSDEQIKAIRQGAIMSIQNRVGKLIRNIEKRQTMKIKEKEKKQTISIYFSEAKAQLKEKYNSYIEWRTQDSDKEKVRQDKERQLIDIISQEKPTITEVDLKKTIGQYRDISGHNPFLADVADMLRKNIKIGNLSDKISTLMVGWEVEQLKNIAEEIKNQKIEGIDGEIMKQFKEMLEEAQKNPNLAQQKQAEAKKMKKGGKK